jgi:hypothetical protein
MSYDGSEQQQQQQQAEEGMIMMMAPPARDDEAVDGEGAPQPPPLVAAVAAANDAEEEDSAVSIERQRRPSEIHIYAQSFREALYLLQENRGRSPIRPLRLTISASDDAVRRTSINTTVRRPAVARRMAEAEEMGLDRNGPQVFRQFVDLLEQTAELRRVGFACDFRDDTMCDEDDAARLGCSATCCRPTLRWSRSRFSIATFPRRTCVSSRRRAIAPLSRRAIAAPFAAAAARA